MTTHRRLDDPEEFNGEDFRADEPTFRIGYREASLSIRGLSVFIALAVAAIISSNLYAGMTITNTIIRENKLVSEALANTRRTGWEEHRALRIAQDRTSCIITMSPEERTRFRERYLPGAFKTMCPWMEDL